jgi:hypothetical protein
MITMAHSHHMAKQPNNTDYKSNLLPNKQYTVSTPTLYNTYESINYIEPNVSLPLLLTETFNTCKSTILADSKNKLQQLTYLEEERTHTLIIHAKNRQRVLAKYYPLFRQYFNFDSPVIKLFISIILLGKSEEGQRHYSQYLDRIRDVTYTCKSDTSFELQRHNIKIRYRSPRFTDSRIINNHVENTQCSNISNIISFTHHKHCSDSNFKHINKAKVRLFESLQRLKYRSFQSEYETRRAIIEKYMYIIIQAYRRTNGTIDEQTLTIDMNTLLLGIA